MIGPTRSRSRTTAVILTAMLTLAVSSGWGPLQNVPELWPEEVAGRKDLLAKEVLVDGRVSHFRSTPGANFNVLVFRNSDLLVHLPPRLAFSSLPKAGSARARGILRREGKNLLLDATTLEVYLDDMRRFETAVTQLPPSDVASREAWAAWAVRRGTHYADEALKTRGRQLDAEALRIEGDRPAVVQKPELTWSIATRGIQRGVPAPEPQALAHRALRQRARAAKTPENWAALESDAAQVFDPRSQTRAPAPGDWDRWKASYEGSPAETYRTAPEEIRRALDRMLLADLAEKSLESRLGSLTPLNQLREIDQASPRLGDRLQRLEELRNNALSSLMADPGHLRQDEVTSLAADLRARLAQPEKARELVQAYLGYQRKSRLGANDATGRILLADQYIELANDQTSALSLLHEAADLDPDSKELERAFRALGFAKVGNKFQPATATAKAAEPPVQPQAPHRAPGSDPLIGLTPAEVRTQLGVPNAVTRVATQSQVHEQWFYDEPQRQVILILRRAGAAQAIVIGRYLLR